MPKAKYHIIRLAAGQECPAGYTSRSVRGATVCTKKLSEAEVAFAAAASVPSVAPAPAADAAVDELERLLAGMGMGAQAVGEMEEGWGGEGAMNQDGGRRRRHHRKSRKAGRKSHKKSHRKSRRQH